MIMAKDSNNNYVKIEDIKQQNNFNGISPIKFKSSGENLENYRIYGQTVDGESVGDRTGNLFDNGITIENGTINTETGAESDYQASKRVRTSFIGFLSAGTYTINADGVNRVNSIALYSSQTPDDYIETAYSTALLPKSFTLNEGGYIRIAFSKADNSDISPYDISNIMLNAGSEALSYEPYGYCVPVTVTNGTDTQTKSLYLPEQIKMVGDEAEYVDYQEQKLHRVRKNLLKITYASSGATTYDGVSISNNDGILTLNGTSNNGAFVNLATAIKLPIGNYILTGGSENLTIRFQKTSSGYGYDDTGAGRNLSCPEEVTSGVCMLKLTANYTYNSVKVYPMIRKADITDDTYEPYITNTELDVTLPALPTLSGTNTLSVETNTKPSKVWGKLSGPRDVLYVKDNLGNILFSKYHKIEGESPLIYKAKKADTLTDYRIYGAEGNVGNLRPSLVAATDFTNGYHVATDGTIGEHGKRVATLTPIDVSAINTIYVNSGINTLSNPAIIYSLFSDDTFIERSLVNGIETVINTEGANKLYLSFGGESKVTTANLNNVYVMDNDKMYVIPVTVEGKNLFDEEYEGANMHYVPIKVEDGEYTLSTTIPNAGASGGSPAANIFLLAGNVNSGASSTGNGCWLDNPKTVQSIDGYVTIAYKATESFGEQCYPWNNKTMLNSGSTPLPYEPYHAPVTTPIYLPEQIRKVGDEAEYIDYGEQKMHRIGADDIDVTLPALPTLTGTNVLSVGTAVQPSSVYLKGKLKRTIYGWHVNPDISDSSNAVTYLKDAVGMTPAAMGSTTFNYGSWQNAFFMPKPCMLKSNGKVDYYLDSNDYTKKLDGTASDISNPNYDGNAMMQWPKIWFKYVKGVKKGQGYFYVANYKADGNFHCWCNYDSEDNEIDHFYTAIYNGTSFANYNSSKTYVVNDFAIYNNKLYKCNTAIVTAESFDSTKWDIVSNTAPVINKMRSLSGIRLTNNNSNAQTNTTTEVTRATANNTTSAAEWYIETFSDRLLINGLLVLMGKSLNTQAVFGRGLDTGGQPAKEAYITGTLNDKGLFWGVTENGNSGVKIFGMENFWGCCWHRTAGLITNNHAVKLKLTYGTKDGSTVVGYNQTGNGYIDNGISPYSNGYVQKMSYNKYGFMPAVVTGGSQSTYYADYHYQSTNYTGIIYALFGGNSGNNFRAGAFYLGLLAAPEAAYQDVAASLSCKPLLN